MASMMMGAGDPMVGPTPDYLNPLAVHYATKMLGQAGIPINPGDDPTAMWRNYSAAYPQTPAPVGHGGADTVGAGYYGSAPQPAPEMPDPGMFTGPGSSRDPFGGSFHGPMETFPGIMPVPGRGPSHHGGIYGGYAPVGRGPSHGGGYIDGRAPAPGSPQYGHLLHALQQAQQAQQYEPGQHPIAQAWRAIVQSGNKQARRGVASHVIGRTMMPPRMKMMMRGRGE